ncbi:WD repeat-containing protein 63-like [Chelonus insularis]|uniref:WD repeat-containing protein 63-like n=1 Tax=Chelonus insularis TaxID=460826 RepID=UPI00158B0CAF|nr:WD repeat-containing protein 63-like [Chelonus insularis]
MYEYEDETFEREDETQTNADGSNDDGVENFDDELKLSVIQYDGDHWKIRSTKIPGMVEIKLSPLTQKILGCEVGEDVTTEYPWVFVRKEIIEDNLDLHRKSSDFVPVRNQILEYPEKQVLIGYASRMTDDYGHFYVCLTNSSANVIMNQIEAQRSENEKSIKNAVFKKPGAWQSYGSEIEVDESIVKNRRERYVIEIETHKKYSHSPKVLVNRNVEDQRDGYVELVPSRQSFNNVSKRVVSRGDQANPATSDNEAQTTISAPINSWSQYLYDHKPINTYNEDEANAIQKFLNNNIDMICEELLLNEICDPHTDDCEKLVKHERDTKAPVPITFTEYQHYHDGQLTKEKVINDLCWHPLLSGIAIATYTTHCKSAFFRGRQTQEKIPQSFSRDNKVLVWSFNDCLQPKLILECPREVTAISIRPLDGNVVVGGCSNGQIAVWSILGKIEEVEKTSSGSQLKYRQVMKNLMSWMKDTTSSNVIYPAAMSSIKNGQKGAITQIIWLATHSKLNENGKMVELEENSDVEELGWQFVTSSEDGSVAFWDLRVREEMERSNVPKQRGKKKKNIPKPKALTQLISPFKILDGVFSPTYMLSVKHFNQERRVVITTMSFYVPKIRRVEVEPLPIDSADIGMRRHYKSVVEKPANITWGMIFLGTLEGDVGRVAWNGFEFSNDLRMNRESVKWIWKNEGIHDGPVTHSVRSNYLDDIILTIGGKTFAIWREDFDEPVFLRRCTVRYTACSWSNSRPTVLMLARVDGTVEIWDLIVKSNEACFTQSVSGRIITGIYSHDLYLKPECVAFCDSNGTMRVFTAPLDFSVFEESNVEWMKAFVEREVNRKPKSGQFIEEAKSRWKAMELERMQRVILEKKGLRAEDLERRREPVLKLRQEVRKKKEKIRDVMQQQDRIFEDTVAFLFPERNYEREHAGVTTEIVQKEKSDGEYVKDMEKVRIEALIHPFKTASSSGSLMSTSGNLEEEIIHNFERVAAEASLFIQQHPYKDSFNWKDVFRDGLRRRHILDVKLRSIKRKEQSNIVEISKQSSLKELDEEKYNNDYWKTLQEGKLDLSSKVIIY